jgi:hypothetical protein
MARPPHSAIVDPKTGQVTPEWLDFLSREPGDVSSGGGNGGVTIIKGGGSSSGGGGGGNFVLDAASLTGTTLASNVIYSSLASVGRLTSGSLGPGFTVDFNSITTVGSLPWPALPIGSGVWSAGVVEVTGVVKAQQFIGDGSNLTNLPLAAHAITHQAGGADAIKLDALALPDDVAALNATTGQHGLLPKLSGVGTQFLNGLGAWAEPPSSGSGTLVAHASTHMPGGTDVLTLSATARVLGRVSAGAGPVELLSYIDLPETTPAAPAADVGRLYTVDYKGFTTVALRDSTNTALFLARDTILVAKVTGAAVARGQLVYVSGASGANPEVQLAKADSLNTLPAIGWALDGGAVNAFVRVLTGGLIDGLDTSPWTEGTRLFVSSQGPGAVQPSAPLYPFYVQRVGIVTRSHATQGEVHVVMAAAGLATHAPTHETGGSDPLTSLAATVITTGTLADARLSTNVLTVSGGYPGGTTLFLRADGSWAIPPTGSGGGALGPHHTSHETGGSDEIVALSGSVITTGTIADARLSANVALKNANNILTGTNRIDDHSLLFRDTARPVDQRTWSIYGSGGPLYFAPVTDAGAGTGAWVDITTTGTLEASQDLSARRNVYATGAFYGPGTGLTAIPAQQLVGGPIAHALITVSAASRLLGRGDSGAGAMDEISLGFGLAMIGTTLSVTGGGGGTLGAHHTTHEPGGNDALVGAAWTAQANVFTAVQRFEAGLRLYSGAGAADQRLWSLDVLTTGTLRLHPLTDAGADKVGVFVDLSTGGDLTVSRDVFPGRDVVAGGRVQARDRLVVQDPTQVADSRNWTLQNANTYLYLSADNDGLSGNTGYVYLTRQGVLVAPFGLGGTPLNASFLTTGTVPNARLSVDVLRFSGGYPGGTTTYLRSDGTFATPPGSGGSGGTDEVFIGPDDPGGTLELWYDTDELATQNIPLHHVAHEPGGADEIIAFNAGALTTGTVNDARLSANVVLTTDPRLTDARTPTAHVATHLVGGSDALPADAPAATASLRTLGTGATQACAGNDSRLTDARPATAHHATHEPGGSDPMAVNAAAATGSLRTLGTSATAACAGNDARLSDARTPTVHAATHKSGGSDAIALDTLAATTDITTLNASTAAHGLLPKLSGTTTTFLRGDGTWVSPTGSGDVIGPAGAVANNLATYADATGKLLKDSGVAIANVALLNAANSFTAARQAISAAAPTLMLLDTAAGADAKKFFIYNTAGYLRFAAFNDVESTIQGQMYLDRAGNLTANSAITAGGAITGATVLATSMFYLGGMGATNPGFRKSGTGVGIDCVSADQSQWGDLQCRQFATNGHVLQNQGCWIYPGSYSGMPAYQNQQFIGSHSAYGIYTNTGLYLSYHMKMSISSYVFPGAISGGGGDGQASYYLASHSSYGLYTNTGLYLAGGLFATSNVYNYANGGHYYVLNAAQNGWLDTITVDASNRTTIYCNSTRLRFVGVVAGGAVPTQAAPNSILVFVDGFGDVRIPVYQ